MHVIYKAYAVSWVGFHKSWVGFHKTSNVSRANYLEDSKSSRAGKMANFRQRKMFCLWYPHVTHTQITVWGRLREKKICKFHDHEREKRKTLTIKQTHVAVLLKRNGNNLNFDLGYQYFCISQHRVWRIVVLKEKSIIFVLASIESEGLQCLRKKACCCYQYFVLQVFVANIFCLC